MPMNVLLITADQWRGDCLGAVGHPLVKTPAIDALAADGLLFRKHFGQAVPCSPARASLLTGLYQMNHRVCRNGTPLDARHDNIALAARRLGYEPVLFGYTDSAVDPRTCDPNDPRLLTYEGVLPGFTQRQPLDEASEAWFAWLRRKGVAVPEKGLDIYLPAEGPADPPAGAAARYPAEFSEAAFLTERFLDYSDEMGSAPWFAHISFLRPHPPFIAPEPYNRMYDPDALPDFVRAGSLEDEATSHPFLAHVFESQAKSSFVAGAEGLTRDWDDAARRQIRASYYGLISEVDAQIGRVLDHLKAKGLYDETLIVLTTDHGEMAGDHHLFGKLGYFDQANHIPLIIRHPDAADVRGRQVEAFSEAVDVTPTILDCLGARIPRAMDGRSLKPFLEGRTPDDARSEVHWEFDFREVVSGTAQDALGLALDDCSLAVIRDAAFKYVHFTGLPPLLFDLAADPAELRNLAGDPAHQGTRLRYAEKLLSWRARHLDRTLTGLELTPEGVRGSL
ncbi:alkaline phosphatase family protein [Denitrobaculum tricleocarpae]|uniref:Alkaline phosphatase family protein n=1 Tax=Denitrobaculum tricleocarpae TaxID=2591009 RepID=A0A545U299_9PROT|nr:alkaline phosphatase family protein [Denitrobaculum tricleocarpae]TQV83605.1 alkaline phosphatase family protein [Denitrobaculum tricleocarpae]